MGVDEADGLTHFLCWLNAKECAENLLHLGKGYALFGQDQKILSGAFNIPWAISSFFGGTSLLIIVGVALDTLRIMESHLLVRKYEGFLAHGTLRGRHG